MVMQTVLPAAVQQQVQLPEEQGEERQDAPKQHIARADFGGRLVQDGLSSSPTAAPHWFCLLDWLFVRWGSG